MRRLAGLLLLAGCGSNATPTAPVVVSLTGTYTGTYTTSLGPGLGFNVALFMTEATDATVVGTMQLPTGTQSLDVTGAYARDTLTLVVTHLT